MDITWLLASASQWACHASSTAMQAALVTGRSKKRIDYTIPYLILIDSPLAFNQPLQVIVLSGQKIVDG
jgi:hypothetical protein